MSVVFDFNDSLSDTIPAHPMLLPFEVLRNEDNELLMDAIGVPSFVFTP